MTLQELQDRRAAYVRAELAALEAQEYRVGDGGNHRHNRRADLAEIRQAIKDLDDQIAALQAAGQRRVYNITPSC